MTVQTLRWKTDDTLVCSEDSGSTALTCISFAIITSFLKSGVRKDLQGYTVDQNYYPPPLLLSPCDVHVRGGGGGLRHIFKFGLDIWLKLSNCAQW